MPNPVFSTVVLSGGGTFGIAYVGAVQVLQQHGLLDWIPASNRQTTRFHACSVGALFALLLYLHVDVCCEKEQRLLRPFMKFFRPSVQTFRPCRVGGVSLCGTQTANVLRFLDRLIERACGIRRATFAQLHAHNQSVGGLWVYTTSLTRGAVAMSHVTHPDTRVSHAVFASMLIPFLFAPIQIGQDYYVDGAIGGNNYPMHAALQCEHSASAPSCVLGLRFSQQFVLEAEQPQLSFVQLTRRLISIACEHRAHAHPPEQEKKNSADAEICIGTAGANNMNFSPSRMEEQTLLDRGSDAASAWIAGSRFSDLQKNAQPASS